MNGTFVGSHTNDERFSANIDCARSEHEPFVGKDDHGHKEPRVMLARGPPCCNGSGEDVYVLQSIQ